MLKTSKVNANYINNMIKVLKITDNVFKVVVNSTGQTEHIVKLSSKIHQNITKGKISKIDLIIKSFEFLLKRESNQSILREFSLEIISQYFPDYLDQITKDL